MPCHAMKCHGTLCHITSCHVVSHHVISCHVMSHILQPHCLSVVTPFIFTVRWQALRNCDHIACTWLGYGACINHNIRMHFTMFKADLLIELQSTGNKSYVPWKLQYSLDDQWSFRMMHYIFSGISLILEADHYWVAPWFARGIYI